MRRFVCFATFLVLALHGATARQIALITDGELAPPARHGIDKLRDALRNKGFEVTSNQAQADYVILAGIGPRPSARMPWRSLERPPLSFHTGGGAPSTATLLPITKSLEVSAKVTAPDGVKWVRLRYRHANQTEVYQTAEMTVDPKSGNYTARIPAEFRNP